MKTVAFTMIALGLALAATPAFAQGETQFTLETVSEGGSGYFRLEGQTTRNPTLNVAPGQEITVVLKGTDDGVHNFCVGTSCSEFVTAAGESVTFTFTAPASGTVQYYCQPHKGAGMLGTLSAGGTGATPTGSDGEKKDTPGFGLVGALVALGALALVLRRK